MNEARRLTPMQRKILLSAAKRTHVMRPDEVAAARVLRSRNLLDFHDTGSNTVTLTAFGRDVADYMLAHGGTSLDPQA